MFAVCCGWRWHAGYGGCTVVASRGVGPRLCDVNPLRPLMTRGGTCFNLQDHSWAPGRWESDGSGLTTRWWETWVIPGMFTGWHHSLPMLILGTLDTWDVSDVRRLCMVSCNDLIPPLWRCCWPVTPSPAVGAVRGCMKLTYGQRRTTQIIAWTYLLNWDTNWTFKRHQKNKPHGPQKYRVFKWSIEYGKLARCCIVNIL